ncbi:MAG: c-type cytochrome [Chitinophagaceae bacterium]
MKKLTAVAAMAILIAAAITVVSCKGKKTGTGTSASKEDSLTNLIARGEYLANHVSLCIDCHSTRDTGKFSMPVVPGTEGGGAAFPFTRAEFVPGEVTPPNITPAGLKDWTDDDLIKAITRGINKKGDTIFPIMPYHSYSRMAKSDILAIVAYIRSLKPIDHTVPARRLEVPVSMFGPVPDGNLEHNILPDPADKVKYGQYLVTAAACADCHTPMGPQGPDFTRIFSGGNVFDIPGLFKVAVANITPDSATGIGTWTEAMFVSKFRNNASDATLKTHPGKQNTIMPWSMYGKMKEDDLKAVYAFLRTVKPLTNKVEKYPK